MWNLVGGPIGVNIFSVDILQGDDEGTDMVFVAIFLALVALQGRQESYFERLRQHERETPSE